MPTPTQLKKLSIGGRSKNYNPKLFLAEHEGELYATNSYWLVPADRVRPLMAHYNLPADKPGTFELNGAVTPTELEPPNVGAILPELGDGVRIYRKTVDGSSLPVFARGATKECPWLALFDHNGTLVGFNDDFLSWIEDKPALGYGARWTGDVIYRQAGPGKPMMVTAKREKQTGGNNGPDGKWIPATWHDDGEHFLGLLMPVRLS